MMTGQELATALRRRGRRPIILLFNNAMYGTIRMHQERRFPGRVVGTALKNPDFAALARAYGAFGATVARTEEFAPAFEEAASRRGAQSSNCGWTPRSSRPAPRSPRCAARRPSARAARHKPDLVKRTPPGASTKVVFFLC